MTRNNRLTFDAVRGREAFTETDFDRAMAKIFGDLKGVPISEKIATASPQVLRQILMEIAFPNPYEALKLLFNAGCRGRNLWLDNRHWKFSTKG